MMGIYSLSQCMEKAYQILKKNGFLKKITTSINGMKLEIIKANYYIDTRSLNL